MSHTPAPWHFIPAIPGMAHAIVQRGESGGFFVQDDASAERENADARLIAAAPELLSALLAIRAVAEQNDDGDVSWNVVDDCARIAIAKATQP